MWPRFSAIRITATGAISSMAWVENCGVANEGMPNQAAVATLPKSIGLPRPSPLVRIA